MPILVPSRYTAPYGPPQGPLQIKKYYTWNTITGEPVDTPSLFRELSGIKRSDLIRWISYLHVWLEKQPGLEMRIQVHHAKTMLAPEVFQKLEELILNEGRDCGAIFHTRQLWLLLQFACLVSSETTPHLSEKQANEAFAKVCLMTSDILTTIEVTAEELAGVEESPDRILAKLIPMTEKGSVGNTLVRAYHFWIELQNDANVKRQIAELGMVQLNDAFLKKYDISLEEFFLLVLCTWTCLLYQESPNELHPRRIVDPGKTLAPLFRKEYTKIVFDLLSQTPEELASRLLRTPRQSWSFDVTVLRERPLLEFAPGEFTAPDLSLLHDCLLHRIYYLLEQAYENGKFRTLFGTIFEAYIHNFIRQFAPQSKMLERRYYHHLKFQGTNDQVCDGLLIIGDWCLMMEFKGHVFSTRQKYSGDFDPLLIGIRDTFAGKHGVLQLQKSLKRMLGGEKVVDEFGRVVDLAVFCRIVPVMVGYDDDLGYHKVRQLLEEAFDAKSFCSTSSITICPLLFLTTQDIEMLEQCARKEGSEKVLKEYVAYMEKNPAEDLGSFSLFIKRTRDYGNTSSYLAAEQERIWEIYRAKLTDRTQKSDRPKGSPQD